jgi:hypothetical protein
MEFYFDFEYCFSCEQDDYEEEFSSLSYFQYEEVASRIGICG